MTRFRGQALAGHAARIQRHPVPPGWPPPGGIIPGAVVDAVPGGPRRGHPVALFGRAVRALQDRVYRGSTSRGAGYAACCVLAATAPGVLAAHLTRRRPWLRPAAAATAAAAVTGAASLGSGEFRGNPELLESGLRILRGLTGRQLPGVIRWVSGLWPDAEDSLALDTQVPAAPPLGTEMLWVSVVRLPGISNATGIDALAAEPGVPARFVAAPAELADADLVVLPGSRATVADLAWLRAGGMAGVTLENDAFRRAFPAGVAGLAGRDFSAAPGTCFAAVPGARLDVLGDLVADHLHTAALGRLIEDGPPRRLPVIPPAGAMLAQAGAG